MKKLLMSIALLGFPLVALTGCSSNEGTVIEAADESDGSMSAAQQAEYEKQMREGGGMSSSPGN